VTTALDAVEQQFTRGAGHPITVSTSTYKVLKGIGYKSGVPPTIMFKYVY
jgi:hypothetical protein